MAKIKDIIAREILDSRGNPTIETKVILEDGRMAVASVPSGASLGKYEALELRDNDPKRFKGKGVLKAVENVNQIIKPKIIGKEVRNQLEIDKTLITLDGTPNKTNLGANAILSVSLAVCKLAAIEEGVPPFVHVSHLYGLEPPFKIPSPIFNLINGGKHGAGNLDFQEFHVIPIVKDSYQESLRNGVEVYQTVKEILIRYGAIHSVGDEGGFAPNLFTNLDALTILTEAIKEAGYLMGKEIFLGLDVAATSFYQQGKYKIRDRTQPLDTEEFLGFYQELIKQYPLYLLEDPFAEDDWEGWQKITKNLSQTTIIGDDLLATNKNRVEEAIRKKACGGILVKPNQIGTVAETIEVIKIARQAGWKVIISHRSGETTDDFLADFAVGVGADFVKFGAPCRGERVVKYNRLLEIEEIIKNGGK
ncbi:MAG: phosphopyruvate hydratase [Microgenomates group bacterium]